MGCKNAFVFLQPHTYVERKEAEAKAQQLLSGMITSTTLKHGGRNLLELMTTLPYCDTKNYIVVSNAIVFVIARRTQQKLGTKESASV